MDDLADFSAEAIDSTLQPKSKSTPAPIRNNNPGALMPGGKLAQYKSPEEGLAALDSNLQSYGKGGVNTLAGVISKWAPSNENNTAAYIAHAAKVTGLDPNQPIDLSNPYTRHQISAAIVQHENGIKSLYKPTQQTTQAAVDPLADFSSSALDSAVSASTEPIRPEYNPTQGMSAGEKFLAGVGSAMTHAGMSAKQLVDQGANYVDQKLKGTWAGDALHWADDKLGLQHPDQILSQTNQSIEDQKHIDAPLMATRSGRVGSFAGNVAVAAPTMLIPGVNTYTGAALAGAGTGFLTTDGDLSDRAHAAEYGALSGVAGKAAGDVIGAGVSKLLSDRAARAAARQAANAPKQAALDAARQAGYKLPPTEINPSVVNSTLEGISGKIKTSQAASQANQEITNNLAKDALGVPRDTPLTPELLSQIRARAGQAYEAVGQTGTVTPGASYSAKLDQIVAPYVKAQASFPNGKASPVIAEIESLRSHQFDAGAAISKIKMLRDQADAAYTSGDKGMGSALKQAAGALEDALDEHLQKLGNPDALAAFRNARTTIAKTYSVQKALNPATGDVSAASLGKDYIKGKPLTGELKTIGQVNASFPKATQALKQNYNALSPLDYFGGVMGATQNPLAAFATFARPTLRAAILSKPYQAIAGSQPLKGIGNSFADLVAPSIANGSLTRLSSLAGLTEGINAAKK